MPGKITGMNVDGVFDKALQRGLIQVGMLLEAAAVDYASGNARTGRLMGSITWATTRARSQIKPSKSPDASRDDAVSRPTQKNEVYIGTNVFYAPFVEYGTRRSAAYPFLRRAMDNNHDEIREEFNTELKRSLRGE